VGKLADGNAEEAKRARLIEQLTNFTCNSVPRGTREALRISVSYSGGTFSETDHRWYRTMVRSICDPPTGNVTLACMVVLDEVQGANEKFKKCWQSQAGRPP
jgi:hypothetical protein